jgi:hypothetical protein
MSLASKRRPQSRPQRPAAAAAVMAPLAQISQQYESWFRAQEKPVPASAQIAFWREQDQLHGQQAEYRLWRSVVQGQWQLPKRVDGVKLVLELLNSRAVEQRWLAVVFFSSLPFSAELQNQLQPLLAKMPAAQTRAQELMLWLAQVKVRAAAPEHLLEVLQNWLQREMPEWQLSKSLHAFFKIHSLPSWLPQRMAYRWLAEALTALVHQQRTTTEPMEMNLVHWHECAWRLLRQARPAELTPRHAEVEMLLDVASSQSLAGKHEMALRLNTLALHFLHPQAPEPLKQRCRARAWSLAEAGVQLPRLCRVELEKMPFPGEAPQSPAGKEQALLFRDAGDVALTRLIELEVKENPDWQLLQASGISLHHPRAALAWVAKRAQSYAVKKQLDVLRAAVRLCQQQGCLWSWAQIRAAFPDSMQAVLEFAQAWRALWRQQPLMLCRTAWQGFQRQLNMAWSRLDDELDEEVRFLLHELLTEDLQSPSQRLPEPWSDLLAAHGTNKPPSPLLLALEEEPRGFSCLEHQRTAEWWSIHQALRDGAALANTCWLSLVFREVPTGVRYSGLFMTSGQRLHLTGQCTLEQLADATGPLAQELEKRLAEAREAAAADGGSELQHITVAGDAAARTWLADSLAIQLLNGLHVTVTPTWEQAFRSWRAGL